MLVAKMCINIFHININDLRNCEVYGYCNVITKQQLVYHSILIWFLLVYVKLVSLSYLLQKHLHTTILCMHTFPGRPTFPIMLNSVGTQIDENSHTSYICLSLQKPLQATAIRMRYKMIFNILHSSSAAAVTNETIHVLIT